MEEILDILEKNCRYSLDEIAKMTGKTESEVKKTIEEYEKNNVIEGYSALINWEKTNKEQVVALIEVKITPQRGEGFDKVAERIYKFA